MKALIVLWLHIVVDFCLAQTVVYTTGTNGQTSAYLIVGGNSTSSISSSSSTTTSQNVTNTPSKATTVMLPTVPYTGQALFTGKCSILLYTTLRYIDGHFLEIPSIGCSDDRPECCPSLSIPLSSATSTPTSPQDQDQSSSIITSSGSLTPTGVISLLNQAPLTVCPKDMTDIDPVYCPSGFTKWGTAILGNTPCASPLSTSYPIPSSVISSLTSAVATASTTVSAGAAEMTQSVTVIVNVVFALGLPCADDDDEDNDEGLSIGAKAGIGVGVGISVLLAIAFGIWLVTRIRRRRRQVNKIRTAAVGAGSETVQREKESTGLTEYTKKSSKPDPPRSEIWSPAIPSNVSDAGYAGYGQGFVDGVRAALSPPMHPQSPPPPPCGALRTSLTAYHQRQHQQQQQVYQMAEAPTEMDQQTGTGRYDQPAPAVAQDEAAELSWINENTRSPLR